MQRCFCEGGGPELTSPSQLRIRACHVHGSFACKDNRAPVVATRNLIAAPSFDFSNINLPPSIYVQERMEIESRWPAALGFHPPRATERTL